MNVGGKKTVVRNVICCVTHPFDCATFVSRTVNVRKILTLVQ